MKKHLIFVLALITVLCMTMFFVACAGCNEGEPGPDSPPVVNTDPTITMNNPNVNMVLGDSTTLTVVITNKSDDYTLSWKSSDTSIATVDGGNVLAIKEGRATITATYSNGTKSYEATASVSVDLGGNIPVLNIDNDIFEDSSYNILVGSNFEIQPYILFNGNKYYDVDITYTVADNTKAEMNGNKIVTKAVGETTITLVASWRGIVYNEMNLMKKVISIKVSNDQLFQLNNGTLSDIILYSRTSWGDKEYKSEMPFVVTAIYNGQLSDVDPVITIADKSIVSLEGTTLKAKSFGSTEISCVWKSPNNETYIKIITVDVVRPVKEFNQTIEYFSTLDGLALYEQNGVLLETKLTELVYGTNNVELIDAFQTYTDVKDNVLIENKPLAVRSDNTFVGVYSYATGMQDVTITIGTKSEITKFNVKTATKVFAQDNAGDFFATFQTPVIDYDVFAGKDTRSGYYILAEDINGIEVGFLNSGSFAGVFDGLGHVINNVKVSGPYGMFGSIIDSATIRNVAFNNVEFTAQSNYLFAYNATSTKIISLDNVYINIKEQATVKSNTSVLFRTGASFKANNVVIIYPFANATIGDAVNYGSLFGAHTDFDVKGAFSNVYVVSPLQIGKGNFVEESQKGYANIDATNIEDFSPAANTGVKAKSTYRYATLAEMAAAQNTYSSLSSDYWEIIDGVPVWKRVAIDAFISKDGVNVNSLTVAGTYTAGIKTATGTENAIVSSNSNKVTVSGNTITLAEGTYNALITVKNANSTVEKVYKVSVDTRRASEIDEDIVIGLNNSKLFLNGTSIASEVPNSVVYNNEELLSASGVLSVGNINKPVNTPFALTISTDNAKYNLTNVRLVSGAYEDTPQSRTEFAELFSSGDRNYEDNFKCDRIEGYYVLVEDLYFDDHNGTNKLSSREGFSNHESLHNTFACTLDGRGYSLNNIILKKGSSMFGVVSDGAVIKNIAFNHVGNFSETEGFVEAPMTTVLFNYFETQTSSLLMENVYGYRYSNDGGYFHGFLGYHAAFVDGVEVAPTNVTMRNVVLEQAGKTSLYPLFGYVEKLDLTNFAKNFRDVFFITKGQISRGWDNVTDLGITEQEAINNRIIKFADRTAMANANVDYSTFDSDYWTNVNGQIVFNSTVAVPYVLDAQGEPVDDLRTSVAGATFTAGIKGVSGDEVAVLEADNSNVTITGNTITLGAGTYRTALLVKTISGTVLASYPIIVDTREPELVEDKLTIVKTDTEVDFSNTVLADKEIIAITFNATDLYIDGVFNGALLKGTKADKSVLDGNLMVDTTEGLYAFNNVTIYDKMFYNTKESREDFAKTFSNNAESKAREAGAYALAENIVFDATNANEVFMNSSEDFRVFNDTLDGCGYAMTDIMISATGHTSIFGDWGENAVIRNIAFNNFYLAAVNNGSVTSVIRKPTRGLLFCDNATETSLLILNNVYQYVEYEQRENFGSTLVWSSATGAINMNNVFIHVVDNVEDNDIGDYYKTIYDQGSTTATNTYVVNPAPRDSSTGWTGKYSTIDDMKAANLDLTAFEDSDMWAVIDGIPVFRSFAIIALVTNSNGEKVKRITEVGEYTVSVVDGDNNELPTQLEVDNANVTINGTTVTVGEGYYTATLTVKDGEGEIIRTYSISVDTRTAIENNEEIIITKKGAIIVKGTFLEDLEISSVLYDGNEIYTPGEAVSNFADSGLINTSAFVYGEDGISLSGKLTLEANSNIYKLTNVKVYADAYENTKTSRERMALEFSNNATAKAREAGHYILLENIVFDTTNANEIFVNPSADSRVFSDTLDGCGYAMTDIMIPTTGHSTVFGDWGTSAVIKNIAFNNFYLASVSEDSVSITRKPTRGLLFSENETTESVLTFDNVYLYVEYEERENYSSTLVWGTATAVVNTNNVFIYVVDNVDDNDVGDYHKTIYIQGSTTATNTYVVNPAPRDFSTGWTGKYATIEEMKAANLDLKAFTDTTMWKVVDGILVWKSLAN